MTTRVTDAEIAQAAGVNQSTVSRWSRLAGFPSQESHLRPRGEVVDFLDGKLIPRNRRILDRDELRRSLPWVEQPEAAGATYGDRVRARWGLPVPTRATPVVSLPSETSVLDELAGRIVTSLQQIRDEPGDSLKDDNVRQRRSLFWVVGVLLTRHTVGRSSWTSLINTGWDVAVRQVEPVLRERLSGPAGLPHGQRQRQWPPAPQAERQRKLLMAVNHAVSDPRFEEGSEGELLDIVLSRVARWDRGPFFNAEYYTPRAVADLIATIATFPEARTWWVPACGTGELAWAVLGLTDQSVGAAEGLNVEATQLAWAGRELRSATARMTATVASAHRDGSVDVIVSNPPSDPRPYTELFETSQVGSSSPYRWLEKARAVMSATSRAVIVMPRSAAVSDETQERLLREDLLDSGQLRAMVHLPKGVFPQAVAPMSIWVLARGSHPAPGKVLIVDAAGLTRARRAVRSVQPAPTAHLATAVSAWLTTGQWTTPPQVHAALLPVNVLRATPPALFLRHEPPPTALIEAPATPLEPRTITGPVSHAGQQLTQKLHHAPTLDWLTNTEFLTYQRLGEVSDLQAGPSKQIDAQYIQRQPSDGAIPMIEPETISHDGTLTTPPTAWWAGHVGQRYHTRSQDLLITRIGNRPRLALVSDTEANWIQGRGLIRIRVTSPDLDPHFLLAYLRQKAFATRWTAISADTLSPSISVRSLRELPIAVPTLERQRAYTEAVTAYTELQHTTTTLHNSIDTALDTLLSHLLHD